MKFQGNQRFQYKQITITHNESYERQLNEYGVDGWQLVAFIKNQYDGYNHIAILMREQLGYKLVDWSQPLQTVSGESVQYDSPAMNNGWRDDRYHWVKVGNVLAKCDLYGRSRELDQIINVPEVVSVELSKENKPTGSIHYGKPTPVTTSPLIKSIAEMQETITSKPIADTIIIGDPVVDTVVDIVNTKPVADTAPVACGCADCANTINMPIVHDAYIPVNNDRIMPNHTAKLREKYSINKNPAKTPENLAALELALQEWLIEVASPNMGKFESEQLYRKALIYFGQKATLENESSSRSQTQSEAEQNTNKSVNTENNSKTDDSADGGLWAEAYRNLNKQNEKLLDTSKPMKTSCGKEAILWNSKIYYDGSMLIGVKEGFSYTPYSFDKFGNYVGPNDIPYKIVNGVV